MSLSTFVESILTQAEERDADAQKLVSVEKQLELVYDLKHLAAFDSNQIDVNEFRANKEAYIQSLTRENTQLVINQIWNKLETKRQDNVVVAVLPRSATYLLPRSKPVPKAKPPTKWERFAKEKGIQKHKKDKLIWDEVSKEWKPRFGYRGANQNSDQWLIEVPDQKDPNVDYFGKQAEEKKERVAKNELQRLRNIARSKKLRLPGTAGVPPNVVDHHTHQTGGITKDVLSKAQQLARRSTASLGVFTETLPEEAQRERGSTRANGIQQQQQKQQKQNGLKKGKKRQHESTTSRDHHKKRTRARK